MFQIKISTHQESASILVDNGLPVIGPETRIAVDTMFYGQQVGTIQRIGLSPFYPECNEGVQRAYVIGEGWTDYILVEELVLESDLCDCTDCEHKQPIELMCPECGFCLGCCDCVTEDTDAIEEIDYQAPRFLWMGRWFPG
jgi:hypothetical protein